MPASRAGALPTDDPDVLRLRGDVNPGSHTDRGNCHFLILGPAPYDDERAVHTRLGKEPVCEYKSDRSLEQRFFQAVRMGRNPEVAEQKEDDSNPGATAEGSGTPVMAAIVSRETRMRLK